MQFLKTEFSIVETESGIVTYFNDLQELTLPITLIEEGSVTSCNDEQFSKIDSPIGLTDVGIIICIRFEQSSNAVELVDAAEFGISNFFDWFATT